MSLQPFDLLSLFECPVCFEYMTPPIHQCRRGHMLCTSCFSQLNFCPTCRMALENIRNLAMEKIAMHIKFPCKHSNYGCRSFFTCTGKLTHEYYCEFQPYRCPCPGNPCNWQGPLQQLIEHFTSNHTNIFILEGNDISFMATSISKISATEWILVQYCYGNHYMLILRKKFNNGNRQIYAYAQFLGTRENAAKYRYRMELKHRNHSIAWESPIRSIRDGDEYAYEDGMCLVVDEDTALQYTVDDILCLNVTISVSVNPILETTD